MIEIALSLGIIAFALVAIIGVLPSGLQVQRENREDTVINQEVAYLLEAIRSGARGVNELTNYVESITIASTNQNRSGTSRTYTNLYGAPLYLTNAQAIVELLSTPKYDPLFPFWTNTVTARMRALTGNALEKSRKAQEFAFRYQVTTEIIPYMQVTNLQMRSQQFFGTNEWRGINLQQNLYYVSVTARWPLFQRGSKWDVGRYRRTVSTLVSGELTPIWTNANPSVGNLYLFAPESFLSAH